MLAIYGTTASGALYPAKLSKATATPPTDQGEGPTAAAPKRPATLDQSARTQLEARLQWRLECGPLRRATVPESLVYRVSTTGAGGVVWDTRDFATEDAAIAEASESISGHTQTVAPQWVRCLAYQRVRVTGDVLGIKFNWHSAGTRTFTRAIYGVFTSDTGGTYGICWLDKRPFMVRLLRPAGDVWEIISALAPGAAVSHV